MLRFAAILVLAVSSLGAVPIPGLQESPRVPQIPHGQDWSILAPALVLIKAPLSAEEIRHIVPPEPPLSYIDGLELAKPGPPSRSSVMLGLGAGILVGITLLLSGYSLIPRAHSGVLRLRALHMKGGVLT